eukprot:Tamp_10494.p3 GENE.Tamp_10494~~Tamp_10494.p3  ORF type:complete len:159 (+),score=15.77 Tamp_10494:358-834(+)
MPACQAASRLGSRQTGIHVCSTKSRRQASRASMRSYACGTCLPWGSKRAAKCGRRHCGWGMVLHRAPQAPPRPLWGQNSAPGRWPEQYDGRKVLPAALSGQLSASPRSRQHYGGNKVLPGAPGSTFGGSILPAACCLLLPARKRRGGTLLAGKEDEEL